MKISMTLALVMCVGCVEPPVSDKMQSVTSAVVTTNFATYVTGQPITVTWGGLPGNAHDWVGYTPAGAPDNAVLHWAYTGGLSDGTVTLTGTTTAGDYVARAFVDDTYTVVGESVSFAVVDNVTVVADMTTFAPGQAIGVSWTDLPGITDWVAVAPAGSTDTTVTQWVYTGGAHSGHTLLSGVAAGTYVLRAFTSDSYAKVGQSAVFVVDASLISVDIPADSFVQSPDKRIALYAGPDGEVLNLRVTVNCEANQVFLLCAQETDDPRTTRPQVCGSAPCFASHVLLNASTDFVSGPGSTVTISVDNLLRGFGDFSIVSAEATVLPL